MKNSIERSYSVSSQHKYRVLIRWTHRKWGPQMEKLAAEGTSIRRAINNALLGFFSDKTNRERRRDGHASLEVQCWREKQPTAARRPPNK